MSVKRRKSDPTKVLHLTHDMGIGGTEQVIYQIITGSSDADIRHQVLCIDGPFGVFGERLREINVSVDSLQRSPGFDLQLLAKIKKYIKRNRIGILHCHQYTPYVYGVLAAMLVDCKVVYTEHGRFYPDSYSWKRRVVNPLLSQLTHEITTISEATRQALIVFEWFKPSDVQVIYNGMADWNNTPEKFDKLPEYDEAAFIFGTIARLDSIKNQKMMLNAFSRVHRRYPQSRLMIVGDGPERDALREQTRKLGLKDAVIFTGFQSDTFSYLKRMDVFLLSSYSEGTSMTLLEAMCLKKPCVVTEVGGNVELIDNGENGMTVPSEHTEAFANAMTCLLLDGEYRALLGKNARDTFLERFQINIMVDAYERLYQSCRSPISGLVDSKFRTS